MNHFNQERPRPNQSNTGASLESLIEAANNQYQARGFAVIQKVAVPWTVIRRGRDIVSAFPAEKSTVDFVGNGMPIAFDAKSCSADRFPLRNIEPHQVAFLRNWRKQCGVAGILIEMVKQRRIFWVDFAKLDPFLERAKSGARGTQSLTLDDMEQHFVEVTQGRGIVLDYLLIAVGTKSA